MRYWSIEEFVGVRVSQKCEALRKYDKPKNYGRVLRRFKCRLHRRDYPNNGSTGKRKNKENHVH